MGEMRVIRCARRTKRDRGTWRARRPREDDLARPGDHASIRRVRRRHTLLGRQALLRRRVLGSEHVVRRGQLLLVRQLLLVHGADYRNRRHRRHRRGGWGGRGGRGRRHRHRRRRSARPRLAPRPRLRRLHVRRGGRRGCRLRTRRLRGRPLWRRLAVLRGGAGRDAQRQRAARRHHRARRHAVGHHAWRHHARRRQHARRQDDWWRQMVHGGVMVHGRRERHHGRVLLGAQVPWVPAQVAWVHHPRSVPGVTGVHPYPAAMAGDGTGDGIWCGRSGGLGPGRCVRRGAVIAGRRGPRGWCPLHATCDEDVGLYLRWQLRGCLARSRDAHSVRASSQQPEFELFFRRSLIPMWPRSPDTAKCGCSLLRGPVASNMSRREATKERRTQVDTHLADSESVRRRRRCLLPLRWLFARSVSLSQQASRSRGARAPSPGAGCRDAIRPDV